MQSAALALPSVQKTGRVRGPVREGGICAPIPARAGWSPGYWKPREARACLDGGYFSREKRGRARARVTLWIGSARCVYVCVCVYVCASVCVLRGRERKAPSARSPSFPCTGQVLSKPPGASFLRHPLPFFPPLGSRGAAGAASESNILERGGSTTGPPKGKKGPTQRPACPLVSHQAVLR